MIIEIVGQAGIGKLTVGRLLAARLPGRLLDNHSIYNVAFALTEFRSEAFYRTVRAVRDIAWQTALELPPEVPLILTTANGTFAWWREEWRDAVVHLARGRGARLLVVHLLCSDEENRRRIASPDRLERRKPVDPATVDRNGERVAMLDHGDARLELDVTKLTAAEAADLIVEWVRDQSS
ncbi:MAG: AAA family ATPase [Sphingomonadales bacterium]|nr:AAA family ATPase [Sphingomonadales bacterium]